MDWAIVIATLLGPILAVQAQKAVERWSADRDRRLAVFKALMATRGATLSPIHVQALNSIDLEFRKKEDGSIMSAWRSYRDHLDRFPHPPPGQQVDEAAAGRWEETRGNLLADMLKVIGDSLDYSFDVVDIKRRAYNPEAHVLAEQRQQVLLDLMRKTFAGETSLKVEVKPPPVAPVNVAP